MGDVFYKDDNGGVHHFVVAGNEPNEEESAQIASVLGKASPTPQAVEQEPGFLGKVGSGIASGWNTAQSGLDRMGQGLAGITGQFAGYYPEEWAAAAEGQKAEGKQYWQPKGGFFDQETLSDQLGFLGYTMGQTLPSTAAGIGAGAATGNPIIGAAVGTVGYFPQAFAETTDAQLENYKEIKNWGSATGAAIANSAIEALSDQVTASLGGAFAIAAKPLFRTILKEGVKTGTKEAFKIAAKKIGVAAAVDAVKGAGEEVSQSMITRLSAGMPLGDDNAQRDYIESAVVGGLLEGIFGAGAGTFDAKSYLNDKRKYEQLDGDVKAERARLEAAKKNYDANDLNVRANKYSEVDTFPDLPELGRDKTHFSEIWQPVADKLTPDKPYTEKEYASAIERLSQFKMVSKDRIKKVLGVNKEKADSIFNDLYQRGDAVLAGQKYLRVIQPTNTPVGVETKHLGAPAFRSYEIRPMDGGYTIALPDGATEGSFTSAEEAQVKIDSDKGKYSDASVKKVEPPHGLYEVISRKTKNSQEPVVEGQRLVDSFATEAEARAAAVKLDPKYSPESNVTRRDATEQEQADQVVADMIGEMAEQGRALEKIAANLVGEDVANVDVRPTVGAAELAAAGVSNPDVLASAEAGKAGIEGAAVPAKNKKSVVILAQAFSDPHASPEQKIATLRDVLNHEIIHVLRNADLLTEKEWDALFKLAQENVPGKRYSWIEWAAVKNPDLANSPNATGLVVEEAIAEMARAYAQNPQNVQPRARTLLEKIVKFFRNLGRLMQKYPGMDVLQNIYDGRMANRKPGHGGLPARGAVGDPFFNKANKTDYAGNPMFASVPVDGMFYKSYKVIENSKQSKASPDQWSAMIRNTGIKREEIEWLQLQRDDLSRIGQSISKGDLLDYIKSHSLVLIENLTDANNYPTDDELKNIDKAIRYLIDYFYAVKPVGEELSIYTKIKNITFDYLYSGVPADKEIQNIRAILGHNGIPDRLTIALMLPSGSELIDNYIADNNIHDRIKIVDNINLIKNFIETYKNAKSPEWVGYNQAGIKEKDIIEFEFQMPGLRPLIKTSHSKINNVIGHARIAIIEIDGVKYLDIQELQSDLHQAGQRGGYHPDSDIPKAPFEKSWHEFMFKRLVKYAIENNIENISWHASPYGVFATEKWGSLTIENNPDEATRYKHGSNDYTTIVNRYIRDLRNYAQSFAKQFRSDVVKKNGNLAELLYQNGLITGYTLFNLSNYAKTKEQKYALQKINERREESIASKKPDFIEQDLIDIFGGNDKFAEIAIKNGVFTNTTNMNYSVFDRWVMPINEAMREVVLTEGLPMFSKTSAGDQEIRLSDGYLPAMVSDNPKFWNWFKESKVVDDSGMPLLQYHSTRKSFDQFDVSYSFGAHFGTNKAALDRIQEYLIRNKINDKRIERFELQTIPVFLSIQNPLLLDDVGMWSDSFLVSSAIRQSEAMNGRYAHEFAGIFEEARDIRLQYANSDFPDDGIDYYRDYPTEATPFVVSPENQQLISDLHHFLKLSGYDGIKYINKTEDAGSTSWIAFDPEQIKSPFNIGEFDPDNPRIMFSATAPIGHRVPVANVQTMKQMESNVRYNVIGKTLHSLADYLPSKVRGTAKKVADGTIIALADRMMPMAELVDRIRQNGGFVSNESDTFMREILFSGRTDTRIVETDNNLYQPYIRAISALPVTYADMEQAANLNEAADSIINNYKDRSSPQYALAELYLYAQHARERNDAMRVANTNVADERPEQFLHGSGMADSEANEILDWFASKKFGRKFYDLTDAHSIRSWQRRLVADTNKNRIEGDLIPTTFYDENGKQISGYEDYVPLRSIIDEHNEDVSDDDPLTVAHTGKGFKIHGMEDKAAIGRRSLGADLIAHSILQNEESIVRAEKNKVAQSFLNLLEEFPNDLAGQAYIIGRSRMRYAKDRKTGQVRKVNDPAIRNDPNVMSVKKNGEEIWIQIHDNRLAKTMTGRAMLGNAGVGQILKWMLMFNRYLAMTRTSYNPEFLIGNFLRDSVQAVVNINEFDIKNLTSTITMNIPAAFAGLKHAIRENDFTGEWGQVVKEFNKHGGKTAFLGVRELNNTLQYITNLHKEALGAGNFKEVKKVVRTIGKFIEDYNLVAENTIRVATYRVMRDYYLSKIDTNNPAQVTAAKERAAVHGKEVTINFTRKGELSPFMNSLYLFYGASMNGTQAMIGPFLRSKKVRRIWGSILAYGVVQDLLMTLLSPKDDDGIPIYDKIPDYVLETHLVFIDPFGLSKRGYLKIPLPYLLNGVFNVGRALTRTARGGYPIGHGVHSAVQTMFDSLNPLGESQNIINFVAPTFLDPVVELYNNKDYRDVPIAPEENPYGATPRDSQRYWNNTSPVSISIADWIARLTGGDGEFTDGLVEFSPNQLEYVGNYIFGGAGAFIQRAYDFFAPEAIRGQGSLYKMIQSGDISANDVPLFRRMLGNISTRENTQYYVENRDRVLRVYEELKSAKKSGDSALYLRTIERYPAEYKIAVKIYKIEAARRKLSSMIAKIRESKTMTDQQKADRITELKKRQQDLMRSANMLFRQ